MGSLVLSALFLTGGNIKHFILGLSRCPSVINVAIKDKAALNVGLGLCVRARWGRRSRTRRVYGPDASE